MDDNRLVKQILDEMIKLKTKPSTLLTQTLNDLKEANIDMTERYFVMKFIK